MPNPRFRLHADRAEVELDDRSMIAEGARLTVRQRAPGGEDHGLLLGLYPAGAVESIRVAPDGVAVVLHGLDALSIAGLEERARVELAAALGRLLGCPVRSSSSRPPKPRVPSEVTLLDAPWPEPEASTSDAADDPALEAPPENASEGLSADASPGDASSETPPERAPSEEGLPDDASPRALPDGAAPEGVPDDASEDPPTRRIDLDLASPPPPPDAVALGVDDGPTAAQSADDPASAPPPEARRADAAASGAEETSEAALELSTDPGLTEATPPLEAGIFRSLLEESAGSEGPDDSGARASDASAAARRRWRARLVREAEVLPELPPES